MLTKKNILNMVLKIKKNKNEKKKNANKNSDNTIISNKKKEKNAPKEIIQKKNI